MLSQLTRVVMLGFSVASIVLSKREQYVLSTCKRRGFEFHFIKVDSESLLPKVFSRKSGQCTNSAGIPCLTKRPRFNFVTIVF